ncbi:hypothetical protein RHSIM_Rhsim13G0102000 [Rhododendron simsii]|uniref:RING-type E3 ubiquitin transferase n=1 Tax=Rhododendron simsii TaxID=118357 RepID=A0A834L6X8_RHOSS|nr:hypothetical protein RHSIM_Rhsim13G0102000 [Rhododendron simsii]
MKPHIRKLLPDADTLGTSTLLHHPTNATTKALPFRPNSSPLDSSVALTALVLLTALFFMGFFSLYLRRFADSPSSSPRPRPRPSSPFSSSSLLPLWRSSNYPKGLDPSAVRSLPLVSYGGDAKHPIDCVICLCEFEDGETVKMIPYCRHVFHPECVDTWLASQVSCPLCRSSRIFGGGEACLGVSRGEVVGGGEGESFRSTEEMENVGPVGMMRRACSYPSVGDRVVLERSLSF